MYMYVSNVVIQDKNQWSVDSTRQASMDQIAYKFEN